MEGWYQRLLEEKEQLSYRIHKLVKVLYGDKPPKDEVPILTRQLTHMVNYLEVLEERIAKYKSTK